MSQKNKTATPRATVLKGTVFGLALAVAGCGLTYKSPEVKQQAGGADVRVVSLTAESVILANRSQYTPRSLPGVFYAAAGGGNLRTAGAIPPAPFVPTEEREPLELRVPPAIDPGPYRIGVGDVVLISTRDGASTVEQLSGLLAAQTNRQGYTVRDDGAISLPDLGSIVLEGLTLSEAENALVQFLIENQIDPAVSIEISEFNSKRVVVGGAVRNPATQTIDLNGLTLSEALSAAGGSQLKYDDFGSIRIYRDGRLYQIPVEDYYRDTDLQDLSLTSGDAVYVDTTYDLDRALEFYENQLDVVRLRSQTRTAALSELQTEISLRRAALDEQRSTFIARTDLGAEKRDYVYLTGEVTNQSRFALPYQQQATLADVLFESGGFNQPTGDPSQIYVLRASDNPSEFGAVTAWHLDASNVVNFTVAAKMEMRPNDIVFIEEQPITKWNRALQQAFPTLVNAAARSVQ